MDKGGVQTAFKIALQDCNIHKKATVHTLRHSYATHLVEAGVGLRLIQEFSGHSSPNTTVIYAHLSKPALDNAGEKIRTLMDRNQIPQSQHFFIDDDQQRR